MSRTARARTAAAPRLAPPAASSRGGRRRSRPLESGSSAPTSERPSTRESIMKAAVELFAERGFHGVAVPEVAQRAGVATGSIYRHFPSKEALANALYQHWRGEQLRASFQDFPVGQGHRAQFKEAWMRLARFYAENPTAYAFLELHNHNSYLDDESREAAQRVLDPTLEFLAAAAKEKVVKNLPPRLLLAIANGAFLGIVKFGASNHFKLSPAVLEAAEQCCWEALRA
ncbi:MAG: TetR/AcrR family transcriptional regulator [Myxococcota bacterium]